MTSVPMIHLHHAPGSRSFRVIWLLEELGLDYDLTAYDFTDGSLRSADHLARSPAGKVPALELDDAALFESGAIIQYLTEREGRLAPEPGDLERADFLQWLHFAETQGICIQNLNIQYNFIRPEAARSVPFIKLETKRLAVSARALEKRLTGRDHLLDSGFSAADCMFGFNVRSLFHFLPAADYPHIAAWWDRMQARPACARALAREGGDMLHGFYQIPEG
ncbi:MAG: glutathione S-transferase family protein [Paracoccus sp. (in: a-proteobacteria)]|uniref:glutathione S-transferase family protein n=1 Tax=Paracoccus sp. TaxID=267 RepID=UPI0026DF0FE4|nr:glutathione S-transferase family protein [Paracoccus sp. (in: a-proteobacteria)]MDO5631424.1 glutathione S-transferase family protein [Paracoccus sp. (in: a-proteobacteria)]